MKSQISDWQKVGGAVGSGQFGVAFRCQRKLELKGFEIVTSGLLKVLKSDQTGYWSTEDFSSFLAELNALAKIESRFVARLIDAGFDQEQMWLVTEFVSGFNLEKRLEDTGKLELSEWLVLADNSLRGLNAIHAANFVHLDLKPSNIMFGTNDESYVIVDLGISKFQRKISPVDSQLIGAYFYMPPEGFEQSYNAASDIFTLGTTLHQSLFGFNIWQQIARSAGTNFSSPQDAARWAVNQPIPSDMLGSHPIEKLLRKMLDSNPNHRPSARICRKEIELVFNLASQDWINSIKAKSQNEGMQQAHIAAFETWNLFESRVQQILTEKGLVVFKLDIQVDTQPDIKFSVQAHAGKPYLVCSRASNLRNFLGLGWEVVSEREMYFALNNIEPKFVARAVRQALESGYGLDLTEMQMA